MNQTARTRLEWIDLTRGAAMVLVVFGHALIGVTSSLETTQFSRFMILLLYSVHMPVLFALAGCLCEPLMTRPIGQFMGHLLRRVLWPYLLWGSLLLGLHFVMSGHTNVVLANYRPFSILWQPPAVMWFLYVLLIAVLIRRALNPFPNTVIAALGCLCITIPYAYDVPIPNLRFVGVYLVASTLSLGDITKGFNSIGLLVSFLLAGLLTAYAWQDAAGEILGYPASSLIYLSALFVSPYLAFVLAQLLSRRAYCSVVGRMLTMIGRHSMAVFVLHVFFTAGGRIVLLNLGLTNLWAITGIATVLGIAAPIAAAVVVSKARLAPLLGWQSA